MSDEIHNQENIIKLSEKILALKDKYPNNKGVDEMIQCLTEISVYVTEVERKNMELQLEINIYQSKNYNKLEKLLWQWIKKS